jgi:RES domain-containing protein
VKPVTIWRVEKALFAKTVRSGDGPRLYGGRWNSPGRPVIYCGGSLSLALLEVLAHVESGEDVGVKRVLFRIELDPAACEEVRIAALPKNWRSALNPAPCRKWGDAWLARGSSVALKVPSAIVPVEFNFLLNPRHPDFGPAASWGRGRGFQIDPRLLRKMESAV